MKNILSFILMMLFSMATFAQQTEVEMAEEMRSSGKIYVVVAVLTTNESLVFLSNLTLFLYHW